MNFDGRPTTTLPPAGPADGRGARHHSAARSSTRARRTLLVLAIAAATVGVPRLIVPHPQQGTATTGAPTPTSSAPSTGESVLADLLSRGRPVTASSTEYDVTPAAAAVDGLPDTRWSSASADPQWLRVDLGAVAAISRVVLRWESAYAKAYHIQTSNDGATWTSIYSTGDSAGGTQTLDITGSGRYVRMYGTARSGQYGYSLWEFEVYGTTDNAG